MTINEIKDLTKYLKEEEVDEIKEEIRSKETVLKSGNLEEDELIQVLNTLFAILVIEKTLESQIEEVEEIRSDLELELTESYKIYDAYISKSKAEKKEKKKRRWLLDLLCISDRIHSKKEGIGRANKTLNEMQNEINKLKQQKSNENLKNVVDKKNEVERDNFFDLPNKQIDPRMYCDTCRYEANIPPREHHHHHEHAHEHERPRENFREELNTMETKVGVERDARAKNSDITLKR